jgi:hypothetical protein
MGSTRVAAALSIACSAAIIVLAARGLNIGADSAVTGTFHALPALSIAPPLASAAPGGIATFPAIGTFSDNIAVSGTFNDAAVGRVTLP